MIEYGNDDNSRQGTVDKEGHRVYIFPEDVRGIWRNRRTIFFYMLIAFYLIVPWIHVGGKQTIKLDIAHREFTLFGQMFYAHNAPMLLFLILGFIFFIGFVTSLWGRAWCGWACPQTVFIDAIYQKIEKFVEGNARARIKLNKEGWTVEKVLKKVVKWSLFTIVSLHISHTFIGYFVGTHELFKITTQSPFENMGVFITMLLLTATFLLDFGWFKEQFCIIACPYGRMQSVIMDQHSKVIIYDAKRGEPRREHGQLRDDHADCVDCFACVKACPTGIDIRNGVQMECIACTQCIDACDEVMLKTKRAPGLVRYGTESELAGKVSKFLLPRNIIYMIVIVAMALGLNYSIGLTKGVNVVILKGPGSPFRITNEKVLNHFQIVLDQSGDIIERKVFIEIQDKDLKDLIELKTARNPYILKKNHARVNVFARFEKTLLKDGRRTIKFKITDEKTKIEVIKEVNLVGPIK